MSIDTTFKPIGSTFTLAPAAGAAIQIMPTGMGMSTTTVRVRCGVAGYLTWGPQASLAAAAAPAATGSPNTLGFPTGVFYIEVSGVMYFRNDAAGGFELTAGQGGVA